MKIETNPTVYIGLNMSNALNSEEEAAAQRFKRWKQSGMPRQWVLEHLDGWDQVTWARMINSVKASPYWPLDVLQIMTLLEEMRHELRNEVLGDAANEQPQGVRAWTVPFRCGYLLHTTFSNVDFMPTVLVIGFGICVIGTAISLAFNISLWLGPIIAAALYAPITLVVFSPKILTILEDKRKRSQDARRKIEEENRERLKKQREEEERLRKEAEEAAARRRMEAEEAAARDKWALYFESRTMDEVSAMTGIQFEEFLARLFSRMGYRDIQMTATSNDQGGDLLCTSPSGARVVIQAKRWKGFVGNGAVQELLGAMLHYDRQEGIVVTNSVFTGGARELAKKDSRITLRDGRWLEEQIKQFLPPDIPQFNWEEYNRVVKDYKPARFAGKKNLRFRRRRRWSRY